MGICPRDGGYGLLLRPRYVPPESGIVTEDQKKEVVEDNPERLQADINTLSSIFTGLSLPNWAGGSATPFHERLRYPAVCIATDETVPTWYPDNSDYLSGFRLRSSLFRP